MDSPAGSGSAVSDVKQNIGKALACESCWMGKMRIPNRIIFLFANDRAFLLYTSNLLLRSNNCISRTSAGLSHYQNSAHYSPAEEYQCKLGRSVYVSSSNRVTFQRPIGMLEETRLGLIR